MTQPLSLSDDERLGLIAELFDDDAATYVRRKNTGGTSGRKGPRYEDHFAVYKIAQMAKPWLENAEDCTVTSQAVGFVDDVVIDRADASLHEAYQLKDAQSVSWGTGRQSIADDFERQHKLSTQKFGYHAAKLGLVVANDRLVTSLSTGKPAAIAGFTDVIHFFSATGVMALLEKSAEVRDAVAFVCTEATPSLDQLNDAFVALHGAWWEQPNPPRSVGKVLERALSARPQVVRAMISDAELQARLDPKFLKFLDSIPGFTYRIERGALHWAFPPSDQGQYKHPCWSVEFDRLQAQVITAGPTSFDELETLLL